MTYKINKTDATLLTELVDGTIDQLSTDITLIGKNFSGFGEYINENFVKLLENFASDARPTNPLRGQLWYDTNESRLKIYDGNIFRTSGAPIVSPSRPQDMVAGDIWIDSRLDQVWFYDGRDDILAGPVYTALQGRSGFLTTTEVDTNGVSHNILKLYLGNVLLGVIAKEEFTVKDPIPGLQNSDIKIGLNIALANFKIYTTVSAAESLVDTGGVARNADSFLPTYKEGTTRFRLNVQSNSGITIGNLNDASVSIVDENIEFATNITNQNYNFKIRSSNAAVPGQPESVLFIDSETRRIGIFNTAPSATLDVDGNVIIGGNLTVEGTTTTISSNNLTIKDKNIIVGQGTVSDSAANNGGIILESSSNKSFLFNNSSQSWKSSEHLNLATGKTYKVNDVEVLSETALGTSVVSAPGLRSVGNMLSLQVDDINIDGSTISNTASNGTITFSTTGTGVLQVSNATTYTANANSGTAAVIANKGYVDLAISARNIALTMDITGLNNSQIAVALNQIAPSSTFANGTNANIHCTVTAVSYSAIPLTIGSALDPDDYSIEYTTVLVDKNGGTNNQNVIQNIQTNPINAGDAIITVTRVIKRYQVVAGSWVYQSDIASLV